MRAQLKGAIVMTQPIMTSFIRKDRPQPSDAGYQPNSAAYATSARESAEKIGAKVGSESTRITVAACSGVISLRGRPVYAGTSHSSP